MAEYVELIDKYRIVQSEETDYNPPSYEWVDNTGKIVRCKACRHRDPEDHKCDCGQLERAGLVFPVDDEYFCAYGEER